MIDKSFIRPNDISDSYANPSLEKEKLGWSSKVSFDELIDRLSKNAFFENNS